MVLQGRGLFYGAADDRGNIRIFSEAEWDAACAQARSWGIDVVHPKVGEANRWWYHPTDGFAMLKAVAEKHGLKVAPYYYCFGGAYLQAEAQNCAYISHTFGAVCPDIEIEWEHAGTLLGGHVAPKWAETFGQVFHGQPHGECYPTLFALPGYHGAFPYAEVLAFSDGWLPMVYFREWTLAGKPETAAQAAKVSYDQWVALQGQMAHNHQAWKPVLPLIEIGGEFPVQYAVDWIAAMGHYGYCGFWYDKQYSPYAEAVKNAKGLTSPTPAPAPAPAPAPQPHPTPQPTQQQGQGDPMAELLAIPLAQGVHVDRTGSTVVQALTYEQLLTLYRRNSDTLPFDPRHALPRLWAELVLFAPEMGVGSPRGDEAYIHVNGRDQAVLSCDSGHTLYWDKDTGRISLAGGPPGTLAKA